VNADVFSLQPVVGTSLWRGEVAFAEEGSFDLEATSTDGAGNVVTQKLTPILVLRKGKVTSPSRQRRGPPVARFAFGDSPSAAGEPVAGAMVSLYVQIDGEWLLWEGEVFRQENPQKTDEGGNFHYLLPAGSYQLTVHSPQYRDFTSEPFTVEDSTPLSPIVILEPRPGITLFGRRLTLPWFLDLLARRKEIALELPTLEVAPTELGVGERAPDFTLPSTLGGETNLRSLKKRKVLITFWTTWDPLSVEQIAILDKLSAPADWFFFRWLCRSPGEELPRSSEGETISSLRWWMRPE